MPDINPTLPTIGEANSAADPKVRTALQTLIATVNDIDSANITDGTIVTADIADGAVTPAKRSAANYGTDSDSGNVGAGADMSTVTLTTTGRPVLVISWASGTANVGDASIDVLMDGATYAGGVTGQMKLNSTRSNQPEQFAALMFPSAGSHTWTLRVSGTNINATVFLHVIEL